MIVKETNSTILSYDEIRQYFFNLKEHINFEKEEEINGSNLVISWEGKLNQKSLFLYGTNHSLNYSDKQYEYIENRFNNFYDKHKNEKNIILSEGGIKILRESDTRNISIEEYGEPGLLAWFARENNVKIETPEPDLKEEIDLLSKHFDHLAVLYYFIGRNIYWRLKKGQTLDEISEYANNKISYLSPSLNLSFKEIHQSIFPKKDFHNITYKRLSPFLTPLTPHYSIINKISAEEDNLIRDPYIIQQILKRNQKGYNIFLVYGRGHLIKWQPLLKYWRKKYG